jgi:hypothetical protein
VVYSQGNSFVAYALGQGKNYSIEAGDSRDAKQDPKNTLSSQSLRPLGQEFGIKHLTNLLNSIEQDWERLKKGLELLAQNSKPSQISITGTIGARDIAEGYEPGNLN